MLILPPGHGDPATRQRRLGVGERRIVTSVGVMIAVLAVVVVVALASSSPKVGRDCVRITFSSSLGAQDLGGCGARARELCSVANQPGGYTGLVGAALAAECRKQGFKVG